MYIQPFKPVLNALYKTGIYIGKTVKNNTTIGTIASYNEKVIKNHLSEFEKLSLNTKSAITYKDKNLNLTSDEILKIRESEMKNSQLETLSHIKKMKKELPEMGSNHR